MRRRIGVTAGCPCGVGPELLARAIVRSVVDADLVFFGPPAVLQRGADVAAVNVLGMLSFATPEAHAQLGAWGQPRAADLALQADALAQACVAAARGDVDAIVTGPVRKAALVVSGVHYAGQTEVVAALCPGAHAPLMVFAGGPFVMGLATVHLALRSVADAITPTLLDRALVQLHAATVRITGKPRPRIVVLGVNPHAGEGGMFGDEEMRVLSPAIARALAAGLDVAGPVSADGFFADHARGVAAPDAVLAMHHDQALAPYKLLVGGEGINITWGAAVPRTSPDHGTADTLAGTGNASALSMQRALEFAYALL